jgi:hypothetical protein
MVILHRLPGELTRVGHRSAEFCKTVMKNKSGALPHFGRNCAEGLQQLPKSGLLFPMLARWPETDRAGARESCCFPERFAMVNLGHTTSAVTRAYAKKAVVSLPPLEDYERKLE